MDVFKNKSVLNYTQEQFRDKTLKKCLEINSLI